MLFVVADKLALLIAKSHHIYVLVFLRVMVGINLCDIPVFCEGLYRIPYNFVGIIVMTTENRPADKSVSASFCVALLSGRVHIYYYVLLVADYYGSVVGFYYAFEKWDEFHGGSFLYIGGLSLS